MCAKTMRRWFATWSGALSSPEQERAARALLRQHFGSRQVEGLKALLAAAPLEGINLSRARDFGRDVDL
jgi:hypothetical protein